ncbi:MAG: hypothetical protein H0T78_12310 [Longispora sp.]|nr:hypothetical protein [Longispora sp. (in: high G+C Gram-positive bacteria)]
MNDANSYQGPATLMYGTDELMDAPGEASLSKDSESSSWSGTFIFAHSYDWDAWDVIYAHNPAVTIQLQIKERISDVSVKGAPGTHPQGAVNIQGEGSLPW